MANPETYGVVHHAAALVEKEVSPQKKARTDARDPFPPFHSPPKPVNDSRVTSLALILALGIGAQWLAWRLKLPSILLLLLFGFLAGPVTQLLSPTRLLGDALPPLVSICVGLILFEGGMSLRVADLKQSGSVVWRLVSVGALVTGVVCAVAGRYIAGVSWPIASLLGALLVVTGPTVIGPLLRHVRPVGVVGPILRWEGIVIDPIGALLAVIVFEAFDLSGGVTVVALGR